MKQSNEKYESDKNNRILNLKMARAGIPKRHVNSGFSNYAVTHKGQDTARKTCENSLWISMQVFLEIYS